MYFKRIFLASATCVWLATAVGLATWPHLPLPERIAESGQVSFVDPLEVLFTTVGVAPTAAWAHSR